MTNIKNPDVPEETVVRHLSKENERLKKEISELKMKLVQKEAAISAFKKWQSRLAQYKYNYWLHEGLELLDEIPDRRHLEDLRVVLANFEVYRFWLKKCQEAYDKIEKKGKRIKNE